MYVWIKLEKEESHIETHFTWNITAVKVSGLKTHKRMQNLMFCMPLMLLLVQSSEKV
jgi:hypothetical protein